MAIPRQLGKTCTLNMAIERYGIGFLITNKLNKEIRNMLKLKVFLNKHINSLFNQVVYK